MGKKFLGVSMYRRILAAIDESERAFKALAHAVVLADELSAKLMIVYVVKPDVALVDFEGIDDGVIEEKIRKKIPLHAEELLQKIRTSFPDLLEKAEFIARAGKNTAKVIASVAKEKECDLLVLGSRSLPGVKSLIMRSVTSAVLAESEKPVLVIR